MTPQSRKMQGCDSPLDEIRFATKCIVSEISIYNLAKSKRVEAVVRELRERGRPQLPSFPWLQGVVRERGANDW